MSADDQSEFINDVALPVFNDIRNDLSRLMPMNPFSDNYSESKESPMNDIANVIGQAVFNSNEFAPILNRAFGQMSESDDDRYNERNNERKERRDNRGSGMRIMQEILGGRGISAVQEIQQGMINAVNSAGGNVPFDSTVQASLGALKDVMERNLQSRGGGILGEVQNGIQYVGDNRSDLESISTSVLFGNLSDLDNDGDIDKVDLALSQSGNQIVEEIRRLHPLIAKAQRDPNFMVRRIERQEISNEDTTTPENQVNLVQQGIAGYIEDINMFSVKY